MRRKDLLALAQREFPGWTWYGHRGHIVGYRQQVRSLQVSCVSGIFRVTLDRIFSEAFEGPDLTRAVVAALKHSVACAELEVETTKAALREIVWVPE